MSIKRLTVGFLGVVLAGILFVQCEKMNGPLPELGAYKANLMLLDGADELLLPAVPLNTVQKLIINDMGFAALPVDTNTAPVGVEMTKLKKIVFQ